MKKAPTKPVAPEIQIPKFTLRMQHLAYLRSLAPGADRSFATYAVKDRLRILGLIARGMIAPTPDRVRKAKAEMANDLAALRRAIKNREWDVVRSRGLTLLYLQKQMDPQEGDVLTPKGTDVILRTDAYLKARN